MGALASERIVRLAPPRALRLCTRARTHGRRCALRMHGKRGVVLVWPVRHHRIRIGPAIKMICHGRNRNNSSRTQYKMRPAKQSDLAAAHPLALCACVCKNGISKWDEDVNMPRCAYTNTHTQARTHIAHADVRATAE